MTMCTNLTAVELFPTHPVGATEKIVPDPPSTKVAQTVAVRPVTDLTCTRMLPACNGLHDRCGHQTIPEGLNFRPLPY